MASHLKNLSDFSHLEIQSAANLKFAIVVSQWNSQVTGALLEGAVDGLIKHGAAEENIQVIQVPGSFELTSGADIVLRDQSLDAVICLGCVIQGETGHMDFVCDGVSHGIRNVSLLYAKPVIFGVLTSDTLKQAIERSGGIYGTKGEEAAVTPIPMAQIQNSH